MTISQSHKPVMLKEVLEGLKIMNGGKYIDATFGAGGHSSALLEHDLELLSLDQDANVEPHLIKLRKSLNPEQKQKFQFSQSNFRNLKATAKKHGFENSQGILFDLGVSSMQLDQAERGFAFRKNGPLDMRMSPNGETAANIVNTYEEEKIAAIIYKYGEERLSRRIAKAIVNYRQNKDIESTNELAEIIISAYPKGNYRKNHPARKSFQALRIYVNDELRALEDPLDDSQELLAEGGRLVVMSYHSLEDRIVKHFIKDSKELKAVNKKPITASEAEIKENPRARSAKLRIAQKVGAQR